MYRFTGLQRFAIAFLFLSALTVSVLMWVNGVPNDPFVFIMLCAMTLGVWAPLYVYVIDTLRSVGDWKHDSGCWVRDVHYGRAALKVYVERRPRNKKAFRVSVFADDSDYFDEECITCVNEYDDYGDLYVVLANAEVNAIKIMVEHPESPF